jgi:HEPN domain-containing protein
MPQPEAGARGEAARWLSQSAHDLADAEMAAANERYALACFLSHQSAEKAVAAYLFARGAEHVWGHALADLCMDAMAFEPAFYLIASVAVLLDKHYLGARYPSALPGGVPAEAYDSHAERAIAIARDVREFVMEQLARI